MVFESLGGNAGAHNNRALFDIDDLKTGVNLDVFLQRVLRPVGSNRNFTTLRAEAEERSHRAGRHSVRPIFS